MDVKVVPGDDFYAYANGGWMKTTEIPADRSSYSNAANLTELTAQRVNELLKAAAADHPRLGTEAQQIGDFYASFMDESGIESQGLKVMEPDLKRIDGIFSRNELAAALGEAMHTLRRGHFEQHQSAHATFFRTMGGAKRFQRSGSLPALSGARAA